jgi:hypothetical protein
MSKQPELPKEHQEWLDKNGFKFEEEYYVKRLNNTDPATEESKNYAYAGHIFVVVTEDGKYASGPCFRVTTANAGAISMIELQGIRTYPAPEKAVKEGIKAFNKILTAAARKRLTAKGFVSRHSKEALDE